MITETIEALDDAKYEELINSIADLYVTLAEESLIETDEAAYNRLRTLYEKDGYKNIGVGFRELEETDEVPSSLLEHKDTLVVACVSLLPDDGDLDSAKYVADIVLSLDGSTDEVSVAWFPEG